MQGIIIIMGKANEGLWGPFSFLGEGLSPSRFQVEGMKLYLWTHLLKMQAVRSGGRDTSRQRTHYFVGTLISHTCLGMNRRSSSGIIAPRLANKKKAKKKKKISIPSK